MTLQDRLAAAEQAYEQTRQIQDRALKAAQDAGAALLRLEGQLVLLRELIALEPA